MPIGQRQIAAPPQATLIAAACATVDSFKIILPFVVKKPVRPELDQAQRALDGRSRNDDVVGAQLAFGIFVVNECCSILHRKDIRHAS